MNNFEDIFRKILKAGPTRPLAEILNATVAKPFIPAGCPTGFIELNATMLDDKQVSCNF